MRRWPYTFAVGLSIVVSVTTIVTSIILDLPLKDPEGFLGPAYVRLPLLALLFFAAGIVPAAIKAAGIRRVIPGISKIIREEWSYRRVGYVATGLIVFYACYVSYRNLKSFLPILRKDILFDKEMLQLDHFLMFGHNPANFLHSLLGTGFSAEILAFAYLAYLPLIPVTLGACLVLSKDLTLGAWYATALSLNWVLGVISYYAMPTLGPTFAQPQTFWELPETGVTQLQQNLFRARVDVLADPWVSEKIHGVAGFASLHVSVVFTACLFAAWTGQRAYIRYSAWVFLILTITATIYFGWHYLADDVAGLLIGWMSVMIGAWATGNLGRRRSLRRGAPPASSKPVTG